MKFQTSNKGFTLIELLVVIAIIALLSGIIVTSLTSSKLKSRDASRVSDLNQIQLALEQYFDRCGQYPTSTPGQPSTYSGPAFPDIGTYNGCPLDANNNQITLGSYISVVPTDPSTRNNFDYKTNVTASNPPTDFVLHAKLESQEAPQQNSYPDSVKSKNAWATSLACYNPNSSSADYQLAYCVSTK
jgi:prepilin-type N-terminal cleavage/methylation domain-containing protein